MKAVMVAVLFCGLAGRFAVSQNLQPDQAPGTVSLRVRVLDSHTRVPVKGQRIQLTFTDMAGEWIQNGLMLTASTDKGGIANFSVKRPFPPRFGIFIWYGFACNRQQDFSTQQILDRGVVGYWNPTGNSKIDHWCSPNLGLPEPEARPGEVVFFIHPQNRFLWSWYDTWR